MSESNDDVSELRASVFRQVETLARGISGPEVVRQLKLVSEDVYQAGMDHAFDNAKLHDRNNVVDAFDLTWLSALAIRLNEVRRSRKPRPQAPRSSDPEAVFPQSLD